MTRLVHLGAAAFIAALFATTAPVSAATSTSTGIEKASVQQIAATAHDQIAQDAPKKKKKKKKKKKAE